MDRKDTIKAGDSVRISLEEDDQDPIRKGMVYEVDGKRILLSQTSPPFLSDHRGRHVRITFSVRGRGESSQRAFVAAIAGYMPNYRISSFQTVPAIILEQKSGLQCADRRMAVRVKPTWKSGIVAVHGTKKMTILDLSLTGAKLSTPKAIGMGKDESLSIRFIFDNQCFDVEARIVRAEWRAGLQYVAVRFEPDQVTFENHLGRKLLMIQREHLARGR